MKQPRGYKTHHTPLPTVARDAPVIVAGHAAAELRRVARAYGGPGNEDSVAKLASACVLRGLVEIEADLALTAQGPKSNRATADEHQE